MKKKRLVKKISLEKIRISKLQKNISVKIKGGGSNGPACITIRGPECQIPSQIINC